MIQKGSARRGRKKLRYEGVQDFMKSVTLRKKRYVRVKGLEIFKRYVICGQSLMHKRNKEGGNLAIFLLRNFRMTPNSVCERFSKKVNC